MLSIVDINKIFVYSHSQYIHRMYNSTYWTLMYNEIECMSALDWRKWILFQQYQTEYSVFWM